MKEMLVVCLMMSMNLLAAMPGTAMVISEQSGSGMMKLSEKELKRQGSFKEKAELFGPGAQVKIVMRSNPEKVNFQGVIDEITSDSLKLKVKNQVLSIGYSQIGKLSLREHRYQSSGEPDPVQVRRVAAEIGVGGKAKIELASSRRFSGTIQAINKESFLVVFQGSSTSVKFNEVRKIEQSQMAGWAKGLIAVGTVGGGLMIFLAWLESSD